MTEKKDLHQCLLDMLKWYHEYCSSNRLKYYMIGGTMLGAVRHKGFIPWDDDIDVGMPRKDYERFIALCFQESNCRYVVEHPGLKDQEYPYLFAKLYDKNTTLVENKRTAIKKGVYIDVFPLDGIGETEEEAIQNYRAISNRINAFLALTCAIDKKRKWYKNVAIIIARSMPIFLDNEYRLKNRIEKLCKQRDFDESKYVGNLVGNWGYKELVEREAFGEPVEYKFETIIAYGVEDPQRYLTHLYGDYMKLPPVEKRESHHKYLSIDLNKSFLSDN